MLAVLLLALPLAALAADGELRAHPEGGQYIADEVLVRYTDDASTASITELEARYRLKAMGATKHLRLYHYRLPSRLTVLEAINVISRSPAVRYAEPNYVQHFRFVPNDPLFSNQWSLQNIGQIVNGRVGPLDADIDWEEALEIHTQRQEIIVAVIDTGVAILHPDLTNEAWRNDDETGDNDIDDDGNGFVDDVFGYDFFDGNATVLDENGHGTLVASIIAGSIDNDLGIAGVAPSAKIMAVRVADDFGDFGTLSTTTMNFVHSTTYAAKNGAHIINFSAGGPAFVNAMRDQIAWLDGQGIILVASAGNGEPDGIGDDNDTDPTYPASYNLPNIISVAATTQRDERAPFSNFGSSSVDLAAPGTNIQGADLNRTQTFLEDFESGVTDWTDTPLSGSTDSDWEGFVDALGGTWLTDSAILAIPFNYEPNADVIATSPPLTLGFAPQLRYRVWTRLNLLVDLLAVQVSTDGFNWTTVDVVFGDSATDCPGCALNAGTVRPVDLSGLDFETVRIRFRLRSDNFLEADGAYIDDIELTTANFLLDLLDPQFQFNNGTSFSAPLVAGAAALVWTERPDLSHRQVRQIVLESVDPLPALSGKVATGGRLNARNAVDAAIRFVPEPATGWAMAAALGTLISLSASRNRGNGTT